MKVDKSKWGKKKLSACLQKFKTSEELPKRDYLESGLFPVISQEKEFISGYSNRQELVNHIEKPIVIFGDHTRICKYIDFNFIIGADGVKVINPIDEIKSNYLFYYIKWSNIPSNGYSRHYKFLKAITIKIPPLPEQQSIALELDAIQSLITKYKEQLDDYDNLAKSIFNEMFGDVVSNDKGWERKKLPEITLNRDNERKPVSSVMREKLDKIYDYYGACGVIDKIETYIFDGDFLLIGEDGANLLTVVKPNAIIAKGKFWVNNHAHILQCKCNVDILYLCYCFNCIPLKPYITGVAQPKLNQANLNKILISLPPLPLQQTFAARITAIESQKDQVKQQITDLQTLFDSRMQYYFD